VGGASHRRSGKILKRETLRRLRHIEERQLSGAHEIASSRGIRWLLRFSVTNARLNHIWDSLVLSLLPIVSSSAPTYGLEATRSEVRTYVTDVLLCAVLGDRSLWSGDPKMCLAILYAAHFITGGLRCRLAEVAHKRWRTLRRALNPPLSVAEFRTRLLGDEPTAKGVEEAMDDVIGEDEIYNLRKQRILPREAAVGDRFKRKISVLQRADFDRLRDEAPHETDYLVTHLPFVLTCYGGCPGEIQRHPKLLRKCKAYLLKYARKTIKGEDLDIVGEFLQCLKYMPPSSRVRGTASRLTRYILKRQNADGSFGESRVARGRTLYDRFHCTWTSLNGLWPPLHNS
jgi:hypothetical protein